MPSASFLNDLSGASEMKLKFKSFAIDQHGTTEMILKIKSLANDLYAVAGMALNISVCLIIVNINLISIDCGKLQ